MSVHTYRLAVEYDGTDFHGLQVQPGLRTIGGALETALSGLFDETVKISAAGRTDAGVHASGQVVSFRSERAFPIERLALAMNTVLPHDVTIREAAFADEGFSARFDATARTYEYIVLNRRSPSGLLRRYAHHVPRPLDDERLIAAAGALVGQHDFIAYCGSPPQRGGTVRTVHRIEAERDGDVLTIRIAGQGFLHHMVRVCIGTLVEVASGRREPADVAAILASRDRRRAGYTAPAAGLFLAGVTYPSFDSYRSARAMVV